jgi:hypothetical protein
MSRENVLVIIVRTGTAAVNVKALIQLLNANTKDGDNNYNSRSMILTHMM